MPDPDEKYSEIDFISTSGVYKTPFVLIVFIQFIFAGIILMLVNAWYINQLFYLITGTFLYPTQLVPAWWEWLLLPLNIYGNLFLFAFLVILPSAVVFRLLNMLNPPKEGIFLKGSKEWRYMHYRFWTAYFPIWLARALPLPWMDILVYRFFGVSIGSKVIAYEGYIDPLFIKIGDHTMTSLNICIFSHLIYHDKIVMKKVNIGKNCIVGPHSIVSPGTVMDEEAILGANSITKLNQHLESGLIHVGVPVSQKFSLQSLEQYKEKVNKMVDGKQE